MQLLKHYVQINHSAFSASYKDPYIVMQASSLRGASEPVIIFTYISISDYSEESDVYVFTKDAVLAWEHVNLPPGAMKSCSFTQCQKTTV